jgi:hypothetical protein
VKVPNGTLVPLDAVAASRAEFVPAAILHEDRSPMVGARVHTTDVAGLRHVFEPPPGIELRVVGD